LEENNVKKLSGKKFLFAKGGPRLGGFISLYAKEEGEKQTAEFNDCCHQMPSHLSHRGGWEVHSKRTTSRGGKVLRRNCTGKKGIAK